MDLRQYNLYLDLANEWGSRPVNDVISPGSITMADAEWSIPIRSRGDRPKTLIVQEGGGHKSL